MSHAVRRPMVGVVLALGLAVTGCGGPATSSGAAATTVQTTQPSVPPPEGAGCGSIGDTAALAELNLVEAVEEIPTTQTFASYLTENSDQAKLYSGLNGVTVFVPVDSAWTKLDASQVQQLADPAWRQATVEYALVPMQLTPADFSGDATSAMATFRDPNAVLSGQNVGDAVVLNGTAHLLCSAVPFDGGLLYLTDTVLLPSA